MERNKEGDDFAPLEWVETKEGDTVGGARLTIEIGAEFPIGINVTLFEEPKLPARLGYEAAGTVAAIGPGVQGFKLIFYSSSPVFAVTPFAMGRDSLPSENHGATS